MGRLVVIEVGLFLLPFLVYAAVIVARRRAISVGMIREESPLGVLAIVGLVLVIASMVALSSFEHGSASGTYVPDRFENGHLVPGQIR